VVAAFWYVVFPHQTAVDILFLIFIAAVWLSRAIPPLYASPLTALPLAALGQLMWFRTGIFAILSVRRMKNVGFGFWPAAREWKIGALYFAGLLPVAAVAGWAVHFASPHLRYAGWETTTLIGWNLFRCPVGVALGGELFSAGCCNSGSRAGSATVGGLLLAALVFGSSLVVPAFPNWRFGYWPVAGVFYGMATGGTASVHPWSRTPWPSRRGGSSYCGPRQNVKRARSWIYRELLGSTSDIDRMWDRSG
jgi:hypothetical protein